MVKLALYLLLCVPAVALFIYMGESLHWPTIIIAWWCSIAYGVSKAIFE